MGPVLKRGFCQASRLAGWSKRRPWTLGSDGISDWLSSMAGQSASWLQKASFTPSIQPHHMVMKPCTLLLLCLFTTACLENEEKITIRADGSVHVQIAAEGEIADLADGYPVPLRAPWTALTRSAERWIEVVGPATGGVETLRKVKDENALSTDWSSKRRLEVEREFARVEDMPSLWADPSDPYAEAFLRRSTSLDIREVDGKTVYFFERVFHARPYGLIIMERMLEEEERGEHPLITKLKSGEMAEGDWPALSELAIEIQVPIARQFVLESFHAHYLRGTASIPAQTVEQILANVLERMKQVFGAARLRVLGSNNPDRDAVLWLAMWTEFRDIIRSEIETQLIDLGLEPEERYAIQFELEREFTEYDHSQDLVLETFDVEVALPGEIVTGNFDRKEGATASWQIHASEILLGDVTLRAVSVLD